MSAIPWEDRAVRITEDGFSRPGHHGDPRQEARLLLEQAGLVSFAPVGLVRVAGEEQVNFLSGLITNQIRKVSPQNAIYAALLSPQGRFLHDFTILAEPAGLLLITEAGRETSLLQRLEMYRLRARVTLDLASGPTLLGVVGPGADQAMARAFPEMTVAGFLGETHRPLDGLVVWRDPRLAPFGWRLLVAEAMVPTVATRLQDMPPAGFLAWEGYRCHHGLPRAGRELLPDATLPMEVGFLDLHGVDFSKGCYVGQETTTRTHHRGTLRKRLFLLELAQSLERVTPAPVLLANGKEAGTLTTLSPVANRGLGILRLEDVATGDVLSCQGVTVTPAVPAWASWSLANG